MLLDFQMTVFPYKLRLFIKFRDAVSTEKLLGFSFGRKQLQMKFLDIKSLFLDFKKLDLD